METTTLITPEYPLCEEKAAKVMRWISESEDISKSEFSVARLFEEGVLPENTKGFLHSLLEEQFSGDRIGLELPPEQLHALISDAFTKTYLYLITPQSFLGGFLSLGTGAIKISTEMLSRLNRLTDYPYFPEMLVEWLDIRLQAGRNEISKPEFNKFISEAERMVIEYSSLERLKDYFIPLFEFHNGAAVLDHEIIHSFFIDKRLAVPVNLNSNQYTVEDLAIILKEAVHESQANQTNELQPIPEYNAFLKELRDIGVILPAPKNILTFDTNTVLPPIQLFISEKLRSKCLEKIFHGNIKEYERTLGLLNSAIEFSQAELNLRTLLEMYRISEDAKVARRLHKALRLRFNIPSPIQA
jgi:hypothetical protein